MKRKPTKRKPRDLPFDELLRQMVRAHRRFEKGTNTQMVFRIEFGPKQPPESNGPHHD